MGQRSQLIVKLPEVYWNENNSNNKPERVKVFHNQWLYGSHFIQYLAKLLETLEYYKEEEGKGDFKRDSESILDKAIQHCNNSDKNYITNTHEYDENKRDYNEDLGVSKSILEWISFFDNNNGYMYIDLCNKKLKYCILNGTEDMGEVKIRTPMEYINLFYTNEKIITNCDWRLLKSFEILSKYETADLFKDLEKLKQTIVAEAL